MGGAMFGAAAADALERVRVSVDEARQQRAIFKPDRILDFSRRRQAHHATPIITHQSQAAPKTSDV